MSNEVKGTPVATEKAKRTPPTNSPLPSVQPLEAGEIGAPDIAKMIGCDARELRNYLRSTVRDVSTDEKSTRYRWKEGDPAIQEIIDGFKAAKANKPEVAPKKKKVAKAEVASAEDLEAVDAIIEDEEVENLDDLDLD